MAGEVRALAQRAGTAAGDIRRLIDTSAQGVADGSREVGEAGRAMGALVEQVRQVAQLVGTLSASQAEQRRGIGQIGQAMNQLDEATQRNAALVEESAAAAASLRTQSERMAGTVARFQLAG
ncbi:methyl-accepting chemotaxis protein I [Piscinibacter sakaiensis]|uniref:Methyl-accepting chemotaxis protein I n=1 Tax=Piscinibacter sakaiensis TaxID=1547922 RepID=A0A0K8P7B7_PISS1|nr:methyl-accepting chemotaxis protein I [Piscinibacter sakaiensis]